MRGSAADIGAATIHEIVVRDVVNDRVDFAVQQHVAEIGVWRHRTHRYAMWRPETGRMAVAAVVVPFHEPRHVAGVHAEFVLQNAAGPDRRRLLIFRNARALAFEIRRFFNPEISSHQDLVVEEFPHRIDRQTNPIAVSLRSQNSQCRHRHF